MERRRARRYDRTKPRQAGLLARAAELRRHLAAWPPRRFVAVGLLGLVWFVLVAARLADLQIRQSGGLTARAHRQQEGVIEVAATRGPICDRFGERLAVSTPVDSIGVFPAKVRNPELTAGLLAEVLDLDPAELRRKLAKRSFQWVKRLADPGEAARVRRLNLAGLHFEKEHKRYYPKGPVLAHVLGTVGTDQQGQAGLEHFFEQELSGDSGRRLVQYDALRQRYASRLVEPPVPGAQLNLTIDRRIQMVAEKELQRAVQETQSSAGSIVVMDPKTGDILALANRPAFDPNDRERSSRELKRWRNFAVSHLVEPGSTFKLVTFAAALEENLADPAETIDCQGGAIYVGSRRIRDHKPFDALTAAEVLIRSSNVGTIKLGLRLQRQRLYEYIRRFGFGRRTGLALPGEIDGLVRAPEQWHDDSIGSVAIGQEVGVTVVQLARAVSVIANGGLLVKPRVVSSIEYPGGRREERAQPPPVRVISAKTAGVMRSLMERVVEEGTGRLAATPGYRAGGKTGTAQKIDPHTGAYSHTDYVASFAGFAPLNDPAMVAVILLDSPQGRYYGGLVAAPVFPRVATQALRFLDVPPEVKLGPPEPPAEDVPAESLADFADAPQDPPAEEAESRRDGPLLVAPGRDAAADDASGAAPRDDEKKEKAADAAEADGKSEPVDLRVTDLVAPDFRGGTVRDVVQKSASLGLDVALRGEGVAYRQWPEAGAPVLPGETIRVEFALRPERGAASP